MDWTARSAAAAVLIGGALTAVAVSLWLYNRTYVLRADLRDRPRRRARHRAHARAARTARVKRIKEGALTVATGASVLLILAVLAIILADVIVHGAPKLTLGFLLEAPREGMTAASFRRSSGPPRWC